MSISPPNRPSDRAILEAFDCYGYPRPDDKPVVVGLRRADEPGTWNDIVGAIGGGISMWYQGTTDPGKLPMNTTRGVHYAGVARILPGYHKDMWGWGWHKGNRRHPCLKQKSPVPFERWKNNEWHKYDPDIRGFNCHRSRWEGGPSRVGNYSHGCIVIGDRREHWELCQTLGYPDPPWDDDQQKWRVDFVLIDWMAYLINQE